MAMTQPMLLALGLLATLATVGMFIKFGDHATRILVSFVASVLWAFVGLSAFNVTIPTDSTVYEYAIMPVVYVGVGMAIMTFLFFLYQFMLGVGSQAKDYNADAFR